MDILSQQSYNSIVSKQQTGSKTSRLAPSKSYSSRPSPDLQKTAFTSHFVNNEVSFETVRSSAPNLGSNTKTQASFLKDSPAFGKKTSRSQSQKAFSSNRAKRSHRFRQRNQASEIIKTLPIKNRVGACGWMRTDSKKPIYVKHNGSTAFASNIMQCGNGWLCSVCNAKINAKRGEEVSRAKNNWQAAGGHLVMMTVTCRHKREDRLDDLLIKLRKANEYFWGHSTIKKLFTDQLSKKGHIKNLEVTYTENNGFHPHNHYALFLPVSLDVLLKHDVSYCFDDKGFIKYVSPYVEKVMINKGRADDIKTCTVEFFLKHFWIKASVHVGLRAPSFANGLILSDADDIESYLTKENDSIGHELTNTFSKNESINQFTLLDMSIAGNKKSAGLFQTFAQAIRGERQLVWSRDLKAELAIDDLTDDEALEGVEEEQTEYKVLAEIDVPVWNLICKYRLHSKLLDIAEDDVLNETSLLTIFLDDLADEVVINRYRYLSRYT